MSQFSIGQRWISNTESTLGLGMVVEVSDRQLTISFPAAAEERVYSQKNAPLTRIIYRVGDTVKDLDGNTFAVLDVLEQNNLCFYKVLTSDGVEDILPELELDCFVNFNSPQDRMLSGQVDPLKFFELRYETRQYQHNYLTSGAVGLLGPRVQLLPHQLYIADHVGSSIHPRVLLADEVGLGKTIEAGLIVHQQIMTGMSNRVLILVPDSLLHQWLVEMLRRFNLRFSVLDEAICEELSHDEANPFEASQLVLCPLSFLVDNPERAEQAKAVEWDLLLVDEAHHLEWHEDAVSPEYALVESLAVATPAVLLLTATPEQLGLHSHFARLRLLDPDRYFSYEAFIAEQEQYQPINKLLGKLHAPDLAALPEDELAGYLSRSEIQVASSKFNEDLKEEAIEELSSALLDRHGTGRILFRNTRAAVKGFPKRKLCMHPLEFNESLRISAPVQDWLKIEKLLGSDWLALDERVKWLAGFLKENRDEKILLICSEAETAIDLENYLNLKQGVRSAVFHEGMSLLARDRAAAYFADFDEDAQLLVCSEIGSEGRNFQFAHHVVMFDLPLNPDLLEQRIGRLDRIGQQQDINIHVPFYQSTAQEILVNWYHHGLDAFEHTCAIGYTVFKEFQEHLMYCLEERDKQDIKVLLEATRKRADELREMLNKGRDKLLEMNSCRPDHADHVIQKIQDAESRLLLEDFVDKFCDQLGVNLEQHSEHTIILQPSEQMKSGNLPGLEDEGITATYSRDIALSRDDMAFLSWEHPVVSGAMDMILSGDHGSTGIGTIKLKPLKEGTLMLEALFYVECIAPEELQVGRFIPSSVLRVLVNLEGNDLSEILAHQKLSLLIQRLPLQTAQAVAKQAGDQVAVLVEHAENIAKAQLPEILDQARAHIVEYQGAEINRLKALSEVNHFIKPEEIAYQEQLTDHLLAYTDKINLKLDAMRLILAV